MLDLVKTINIYEAKTHLSALIDEAVRGEEIILAKSGKPLVRLVPVRPRKPSDAFGMDRGKVTMASDFDATPRDFRKYS